MKSHHRNTFATLTVVLGLSMTAAPGFASQSAQTSAVSWAQKAPNGVMQKLAQGAPQDLIVLFDDTGIEQEAKLVLLLSVSSQRAFS